jgi:hypothetical protein
MFGHGLGRGCGCIHGVGRSFCETKVGEDEKRQKSGATSADSGLLKCWDAIMKINSAVLLTCFLGTVQLLPAGIANIGFGSNGPYLSEND